MCLAYPARVVAVTGPEAGGPEAGGPEAGGPEAGGPEAGGPETVEVVVGGRRQRVVLLTLDGGPPVRAGDWLLVQSGLALRRLSADQARDHQRLLDDLNGGPDER